MNPSEIAERAARLIAELKAARTAWHESYGVPVSAEYAGFMEAIGRLTDFVDDRNRSICKAQRSGVGGNDPQDCDWPFCGCDPKADKVIEAIEESGFKIVKNGDSETLQSLRDAINLIHSEANRSERGGDDGTAAHWRDVAAILSGNLLAETVRMESRSGAAQEVSPPSPWRQGSKVPTNIYEGDRPICQTHTVADAERIVKAVNKEPKC